MARTALTRLRTKWDDLPNPVPGNVPKSLEELGIEIYRVVGDEVTGKCPAHVRRTGKQDRHPSWSVNVETGQHNCFSCGFRGPFYVIVKEALGLNDDDAVSWVKARGSIDRVHRILHGSDYGEESSEEISEADLALFTEVPQWACDARDFDGSAADEYGVLWVPDKKRWITPIREPDTNLLMGWQEKGHKDRYFRNYPRNVKKATTLFGVNELRGDTAILVESPLDVVKIHSAGLSLMAVSSFGVNVSDVQLALLSERVRHLVSALDHDKDGDRLNEDLIDRVRGRMKLSFWDYSHTSAKDPGDQTDDEIHWSFENAYASIYWERKHAHR